MAAGAALGRRRYAVRCARQLGWLVEDVGLDLGQDAVAIARLQGLCLDKAYDNSESNELAADHALTPHRTDAANRGKVVTQVTTQRRSRMAEIGVKQLKATASAVIDEVEGGAAYVVTKRGRPAAVLLPVEEAEDLVLANADEYIRLRRQARTAHARVQTVSLSELD